MACAHKTRGQILASERKWPNGEMSASSQGNSKKTGSSMTLALCKNLFLRQEAAWHQIEHEYGNVSSPTRSPRHFKEHLLIVKKFMKYIIVKKRIKLCNVTSRELILHILGSCFPVEVWGWRGGGLTNFLRLERKEARMDLAVRVQGKTSIYSVKEGASYLQSHCLLSDLFSY
jgi:hypothetical protein